MMESCKEHMSPSPGLLSLPQQPLYFFRILVESILRITCWTNSLLKQKDSWHLPAQL